MNKLSANNIKSLLVFLFSLSSFLIIIFLNLSVQAWINPEADITLEGNKLYDQGNYDQALEKYGQALIELPENSILHFNMGNVAYKKEDYQQAEISYNKALDTDNPLLEAKVNYNIGNCKFKQGKLKENTGPDKAIELYRRSLDYYKRAIEVDANNKNAKFNHEFVERYIKELASKSKPPKDQQNKDKQEQQQDQQKKEQKQGQEKKEEEQKQEEKEGQSEEDKKEEQEKKEEEQKDSAEAEQEQEKTEMSEEEARRLLDSLREEDIKNLDKKPTRTGREPRYKDW